MRWEDERYVRIYTRDTADWMALSWDAQALFMQLCRKSDRAGFIPLGRHGKRAAAIVIGRPDMWPHLEPALEELLVDGCVVVAGESLLIRNFLTAQEAPSSDAKRKRDQRERDRDVALNSSVSDQLVTKRDEESQNVTEQSQNVTKSHEVSRGVTSGHEVSLRTVPSRAVPSRSKKRESANADPLRSLWNEIAHPELPRWRATGPNRGRAVQSRLGENPDPAFWRTVIERMNASSFCRGRNDRGWRADPDFLLKPETANKILEGKFDDRPSLRAVGEERPPVNID